MVKKSILFLSLCSILLVVTVALLERSDHVCFDNGYGIKSLNGEFQTINYEVVVEQHTMKNRVLRGKVVSYAYDRESEILTGELDVSVLRNKYLSELIEEEDKDGFFIINTKTGVVVSGLEKNAYISHIREFLDVDPQLAPIGYFDRLYWNCL